MNTVIKKTSNEMLTISARTATELFEQIKEQASKLEKEGYFLTNIWYNTNVENVSISTKPDFVLNHVGTFTFTRYNT